MVILHRITGRIEDIEKLKELTIKNIEMKNTLK